MCLAVPALVTSIAERTATVDALGVTQRISVRLTPEARVGDYVLVHAGFAIQVIDPAEAAETLELIASMPELVTEEPGSSGGTGHAQAEPSRSGGPAEQAIAPAEA